MDNNYTVGSILKLKKVHPCGNDLFTVLKTGIDDKIKCNKCEHVILLPKVTLKKRIKQVIINEKK